MTVVDTYRVVRRQDLGGGRFREHGELMPEAHLFFAAGHWLHTGGMVTAEVDEDEFRAAVQEYCPDQAQRIYDAVGLSEGVMLEGEHGSPRSAPMVPVSMPARANTKTVKLPPKIRGRQARAATHKQQEVTIRATDAPPGAPTPGVEYPLVPEEIIMEPTEGAKHHYEDAGTVDPHSLNEALTATRPSDIETHDTEAAYKQPEAVTDVEMDPVTGLPVDREAEVSTGVAENPIDEPIGADLDTGEVAHNDGSGSDFEATAGGVTPRPFGADTDSGAADTDSGDTSAAEREARLGTPDAPVHVALAEDHQAEHQAEDH